MKKWYHYLMLATLTLGLWLVSAQAFAHDFRLTNGTSDMIYGRCGTDTAYGLTTGQSRNFSCPGQLIVLAWNTDGTDKASFFECSSYQVQHVTVTPSESGWNLVEACVETSSITSAGS